jgi:hypothetical protein
MQQVGGGTRDYSDSLYLAWCASKVMNVMAEFTPDEKLVPTGITVFDQE